ncbi:hypothetical protein SEA_ECLIPTUS_101 [Gordonia phage Ecliptus]|uniref:Uncharacterized protein n=2 Tax=Caudoviricetes TaxID=2731619 RepID=A0A345L1A0_9CAUD|nr:hypothetical protein HOT72_gp093 [Gordonia phage Apricot]YP_009808331.1 hypothetical protein HOT93_gp056 [Gordonia phage Horus]QYC53760.1 hypothetical protein SEA_LEROY_94 [Gordonia phage Leroy]UTN91556.1 hypothetical protein SEA_PERIWINKLE_102 [Gordonia phage Periwinkle]WAB10666.1 hypothetical protein SEA_ECLIPTUS_101 [Gordonia phage Ecliptus]WNM69800.1 hypothetical protein SEA_CRATER_93 [Gordonia phage Crater]AXH49052.1 hypothetical protein SEA_APRICOT_93 [Gordonia phage Apricot]
MSELDLDAIEARADAATEESWEIRDGFIYPLSIRCSLGGIKLSDAEFIAHARTDVPALVSRVRDLEAREKRVRTVLDAEEEVVESAAVDYGAMLPRTVMIDAILTALEDPS